MTSENTPGEVVFEIDLTHDEMRRRAEVVRVLGPEWDPAAAVRSEEGAYDLLYSGLDAEQQRIHDELVQAGVLPRRDDGRDAA